MRSQAVLLAGFGLLCFIGSAQATPLFDTVTGISALSADGPHRDGLTILGDSFTAASPGSLSIGLWLAATNTSDGGSATVYLVADSGSGGGNGIGGYPTIENGSGSFTGFTGTNSQTVAIISDAALSSTAALVSLTVTPTIATLHDEYWVVVQATAGASFEWFYARNGSGVGTANQAFFNNGGGNLTPLADSNGPYMMVVAAATGVPEPGTLSLFGGALAGLAWTRRRRTCSLA